VPEPDSLPLACPRCALRYPLEERFCEQCGMPLTYAGKLDAEQEATEKQARARKIKPRYTHGDLRRVATGRQQPEAEFIQLLLLEEGIPSTLRRTAGFDVPDMLAAGPRDVLVPESGLEAAHQVLLDSDIEVHQPRIAREEGQDGPAPGMVLAGVLLAAAIVALLVWLAGG
jgi:hypothetical protein